MTHDLRTALIVEDDPATRKLLSIVLEREGLAVVALEAVPEAFKWLEQHRPILAVLDVNLPGGTGFEIVQLINDLYGHETVPPVVFVVSGLRQEHNVLHGLRLGVAEYLTKPFSPLELIARVRRHLPDPEDVMQVLGSKVLGSKVLGSKLLEAHVLEAQNASNQLVESNQNDQHFERILEFNHPEPDHPESDHLELSVRKPA
jgi:DNA-binding response OmpR family regulator